MSSLAASRVVQAERFLYTERRLFEVLGGWVPTVPEPEVKLLLRAHSFQHAWHADLWEGLLPADRNLPELAPGPGLPALLDALAQPSQTVERLAGAYQVLSPALVAAYRGCRARASPATEGPLLRALGLMLADETEAQWAGELLLAGSKPSSAHRERLEALLGSSGLLSHETA